MRKDCPKLDRLLRFISLWKLLSKSPLDRTLQSIYFQSAALILLVSQLANTMPLNVQGKCCVFYQHDFCQSSR
jgi:hypothetical protein